MLKKLPNLIKLFFILFLFVGILSFVRPVLAAPTPTPTPTTAPDDDDPSTGWIKDQEVTFVGKTATRANDFLEWTLSTENYRWITIPIGTTTNPIQDFWVLVRNIVFVLLALFVLGAAFVMIATRGQNLTIMKFIPRFITIVVLVVLSFAIIRFLYQATDVIQGFFLSVKDPATNISRNIGPQDLLYIAFNYKDFIGFRRVGVEFDESAFISLLLVKLTAITYYVMTGLLIIRKIILWFFIIVSPIFPLLLFFRPVRNTAKIWLGEFFRWLLYAPLFALFLHGLVNMWRDRIPLNFDYSKAGQIPGVDTIYPTAINILLGGPGQILDINNSVNLRDTFALYVVALLMLWVVILLPFLLLQIFLDYLNNISIAESPVIKRITSQSWFNRAYGSAPPSPSQPPQQPAPFGFARNLPFFNKRVMEMPASRTTNISEPATLSNIQSVRETRDVLRLANLSVPKMRDIARFETSMLRHDTVSRQEVSRFHETLERISKPTIVASPVDREKFTTIKEKLVSSQRQGDPLATSVMNATKVSTSSTQVVNETKTTVRGMLKSIAAPEQVMLPMERERVAHIKQQLVEGRAKGDSFSTSILEHANRINDVNVSEKEKDTIVEKSIEKLHEQAKQGNKLASSIITRKEEGVSQVSLPSVNKVQQVSIEEYEDVRKMWQENYQNMDTPVGPNGQPIDKHTFIAQDIDSITETINLLSSENQENVDKGMDRVASILPFLLLGGFSKSEVISYLKAKLEAAKAVMTGVDKKQEDEDTMVERGMETKAGEAQMTMKAEIPLEETKDENGNSGDGVPPPPSGTSV